MDYCVLLAAIWVFWTVNRCCHKECCLEVCGTRQGTCRCAGSRIVGVASIDRYRRLGTFSCEYRSWELHVLVACIVCSVNLRRYLQ